MSQPTPGTKATDGANELVSASAAGRQLVDILLRGRTSALVVTLAASLGSLGWSASLGMGASPAPRPAVKVGVSLAVTGTEARWGVPMLHGIQLAVEDVNAGGGAGGRALETSVLDSAGLGVEGISRARGTSNFEQFIGDPAVVAVIGPQTSGEARAVAPLLSRAGLATITPSATTFDLTDPALRDRFRPGGRTVFFRTIGTDLAQSEAMARFAHARLGARRLVLVDDGTDFGVRLILTFARQARALGMTVLAQSRITGASGDYRAELRELRALDPEALYFGGGQQVGLKLARQVAEVLPSVHRLAAESLLDRAFPVQAGAAAEGWYVSNVAPPDPRVGPAATAWADRFRRRFGDAPSSYALTGYTAARVIADAVARVARRDQAISRTRVREAIQATRLFDTPQGVVAFDSNGDLERPVVSIYQVRSGAFHHIETVPGSGTPRAPSDGDAARR